MARDVGIVPGPVAAPRGIEPMPVIPAENVIPHIVGERFWTDRDGPHAVQVAQVNGLVGNPAVRLYSATLAPGIPRYGQYHSAIPYLPVTLVEAVYANEGTSDIAIVTITYGFVTSGTQYFLNEPGDTVETLPQVEFLTTVQPARTQFDVDGNQILVKYVIEDEVGETSEEITQAGSVEYMLPMETVRYMRREWRDPQAKARNYVGRINSVGVFGDPPHMWLCTHLGGPSDDGGATFNVTYEFQRNSDSWNPTVVPTDPATGQPVVLSPADIASGLAVVQVRLLPEVDFEDLNLTLPGRPR